MKKKNPRRKVDPVQSSGPPGPEKRKLLTHKKNIAPPKHKTVRLTSAHCWWGAGEQNKRKNRSGGR